MFLGARNCPDTKGFARERFSAAPKDADSLYEQALPIPRYSVRIRIVKGTKSGRALCFVGALWAAGLGCAPKPVPDPVPAPPPVAPAPVVPVAPAPVAPPEPPPPPPIVVNQADLFGQLEGKQGPLVTIRALLVMTKNRPAVGSKGTLSYSTGGDGAEKDWLPIGEVEVKRPLDDRSHIQVRLLEGDKPILQPGQKKPGPLPKHVRLRFRWEY